MSYSDFLTNHPLDCHAFQSRRRRPEPVLCRPGVVVGVVLGIVFVAAIAVLKAEGATAPPNPVVLVETDNGGRGSGVIVSPDGKVLTAEHVIGNDQVQSVIYRGRKFPAKGLYAPVRNGRDEAYLLQFDAGSAVPFWPVAKAPPKVGDVVCSHGYPWATAYTMNLGQVTRLQDGLIDVNFWVIEGNSGGPLCNIQGEVIGLASTRGPLPGSSLLPNETLTPKSSWVGLPSIRAALAGKRPQGSNAVKLYVFTSPTCAACQRFKQDQKGPLGIMLETRGYDVEFVTHDGTGWDKPDIVRQCERTTRRRVAGLPTFWRAGAPTSQLNYTTADRLLDYCTPPVPEPYRQTPTGIGELFPPEPKAHPAGPEPEPSIDWTAVKIVVLRSNPELSGAAKAALKGFQDQLGAPIRRRVAELTDGRADVQLVHEQLKPTRFAAVEAAVGKPVDRLLVVALVQKSQDSGYIRGKLIERLTEALGGYLEGKPIEVITERVHPVDFAAVNQALLVPEEDTDPSDAPWWLAGVLSVVSLVVGFLGSKLRR